MIILKGDMYYRINEACKEAGISRNTFLRWVRLGKYPDVRHRNRNNWRLFSQEEVNKLKVTVEKIRVGETIS